MRQDPSQPVRHRRGYTILFHPNWGNIVSLIQRHPGRHTSCASPEQIGQIPSDQFSSFHYRHQLSGPSASCWKSFRGNTSDRKRQSEPSSTRPCRRIPTLPVPVIQHLQESFLRRKGEQNFLGSSSLRLVPPVPSLRARCRPSVVPAWTR